MRPTLSLRSRMMLLFCAVTGVLVAGCYLAFYLLFTRIIDTQFDRRLLAAASPVVADLTTDKDEDDVRELNLPDEYFELLDSSGRTIVASKNFETRQFNLAWGDAQITRPSIRMVHDPQYGQLRVGLVPFRLGNEPRVLAIAMPTRDRERAVQSFRRIILWLFPLSLLLTGAVAAWYVGRSLQPVGELTRHAAEMAEQVGDPGRRDLWTPLPVTNPHDELGRLAETFNRLFARVDSALNQLRQFVSDASHELRTPLSVLEGETELILSEPRSAEEYRKTLRTIDDELKKLSRIVEGLFTLAMADAGQLRLASEPLYLNEVLEETCSLAEPLAQAKSISIQRDLRRDVAYAGDEAFLRQLFFIFLDNAVKYSLPNTRIQVQLTMADGTVQASFQDQGAGIAGEDLPRIFERFYRAAPPSSGENHSGGLGLAIAQAIARAQGGSIECESTPGVGSTFTVKLRLNRPPEST